jgi:CxxC-x17-CxxC domain-containing protein
MGFSDKWIVCADCGRQFLWDVGEQLWYHEKHLANQPKHCKSCRDRRRAARLNEPRHYSKVSCDRCGNPTYVPFVPLGIKPIYCRSCLTAARA